MSQFIESIKIVNQKPCLLELHQERINRTLNHHGEKKFLNIEKHIQTQKKPEQKTMKCRVVYSLKSIEKVEFMPPKNHTLTNIKVVIDNEIDYTFKFLERKRLDLLYAQREMTDEIIIIKNNLVTDAYYFNLLFYSKKTGWTTPKKPLLKGVKRQSLLQKGTIKEKDIFASDIRNYDKIRLINAMVDFEDALEISTKNIFF